MIAITIGYESYLFPTAEGIKIAEALSRAEIYKRKYWGSNEREKRGMTEEYTYHVYPNTNAMSIEIVSDDVYRMAKLAGKPEKD